MAYSGRWCCILYPMLRLSSFLLHSISACSFLNLWICWGALWEVRRFFLQLLAQWFDIREWGSLLLVWFLVWLVGNTWLYRSWVADIDGAIRSTIKHMKQPWFGLIWMSCIMWPCRRSSSSEQFCQGGNYSFHEVILNGGCIIRFRSQHFRTISAKSLVGKGRRRCFFPAPKDQDAISLVVKMCNHLQEEDDTTIFLIGWVPQQYMKLALPDGVKTNPVRC